MRNNIEYDRRYFRQCCEEHPDRIDVILFEALERASVAARKQVLRSAQMQRPDRELLADRGYLQEICKGWYLLSRPVEKPGNSTAWYGAYRDFLSVYLDERFGSDYCLSATSSMDAHIGANLVPRQVVALTAHGGKMLLELPHNTSVLVYQDAKNLPRTVENVLGVRVMPLAMALCRVPPSFFENQPLNAEIALRAVKFTDVRISLDFVVNGSSTQTRSTTPIAGPCRPKHRPLR